MTPGGTRSASLRQAIRDRRRVERDEIRRFTRDARRRRAVRLTITGIILALVAVIAVALFSPILSVREIRVAGAERQSPAEVEAALEDLRGRPLALVTDADISARLAPFVLIQSYGMRVEPPSRLVVQIVERQPIGSFQDAEGFAVVDAAGVELWRAPAAAADVPTLDLGGQPIGSVAFESAAAVSLAMPAPFRARVAIIQARSTDDVRLALRDGTQVVWGSADDSERKAQVLQALVVATAGERVSVYDVSSPETPITR